MEQELIEEGESYCGTAACVRIRRSNGLVYVWESEVPAVVMTTTVKNWDAFQSGLTTEAEQRGWIAGVRWAAAESDAQAAGREPVYILDITDHLRACADNPDRRSAVPRSEAPAEYVEGRSA